MNRKQNNTNMYTGHAMEMQMLVTATHKRTSNIKIPILSLVHKYILDFNNEN